MSPRTPPAPAASPTQPYDAGAGGARPADGSNDAGCRAGHDDAPNFRLVVDEQARTVRVEMDGIWTLATIDDYERAMAQELRRFAASRQPPKTYDILVLLGGGIQRPDVSERIRQVTEQLDVAARRLALVPTTSSLRRLQLRRFVQTEARRVFACEQEALAWLSEGRARPFGMGPLSSMR